MNLVSSIATSESLTEGKKQQQQLQQQVQNEQIDYSHKGENRHSKNKGEDENLDIKYLKPNLKSKIKERIRKK